MSDFTIRLFREALGRLEGGYRGDGLDAMASPCGAWPGPASMRRGIGGFPFGKHRGAAHAARITSTPSTYPPSVLWS